MKKLYLTLAAALIASASMSARELTFYIGDKPIEAGQTVTFNDITVTQLPGGFQQAEMKPDLYIGTDIVSSSISVTAKCISGQDISMCCGGLCQAGQTVTKGNLTIQSNQKLALDFDYSTMLSPDVQVPQVVTEFEAVDTKHTETIKTFTLIMNSTNGTATLIAGNSAFRAVNGAIEYSFTNATEVSLYSITGARVFASTLDGCGSITTANLTAGLYIYKLGNGKSGKLYIR